MDFLTVEDVAARLGVRHGAVRRAIARGDLPAIKVCSRVRIDPADVNRWLATKRIGVPTRHAGGDK